MGIKRKKVRSARTIQLAGTVIMAIMLFMSAVILIWSMINFVLLLPYDGELYISVNDSVYTSILYLVVTSQFWNFFFFAFAIIFLIWQFRVYKNLQITGAEGLKHSAGWSVGWYFIPFANLIKPYHVMKETFAVSLNLDEEDNTTDIVLRWWVLYIVFTLLQRGANGLPYDTYQWHLIGALIDVVIESLTIISGIMLLIIMNRITTAQERNIVDNSQKNEPAVQKIQ